MSVSIHAPARGATCCHFIAPILVDRFNPRARAGRDPMASVVLAFSACFNPRARAGRDLVPSSRSAKPSMFQSTRPRGARLLNPGRFSTVSVFQSTRPRGARLDYIKVFGIMNCFNPRARAGRDKVIAAEPSTVRVSIHAPARGATYGIDPDDEEIIRFNPRARAGRDKFTTRIDGQPWVSIHAPARGAT